MKWNVCNRNYKTNTDSKGVKWIISNSYRKVKTNKSTNDDTDRIKDVGLDADGISSCDKDRHDARNDNIDCKLALTSQKSIIRLLDTWHSNQSGTSANTKSVKRSNSCIYS